MKTRNSHVSNSSSSSFIVHRDLTDQGICCAPIPTHVAYGIVARKVRDVLCLPQSQSREEAEELMTEICRMLRNRSRLYLTQPVDDAAIEECRGLKWSIPYQVSADAVRENSHRLSSSDNDADGVWIYDCDDPEVVDRMPMVELVERIGSMFPDTVSASFSGDTVKVSNTYNGARMI